MKFCVRDFLTAAVAYGVYCTIAIVLVGFTAAIATPAGYFDWFRDNNLIWLGLFLWRLVTDIPVMALTALLVSFLAMRFARRSWVTLALLMSGLYLLHFYAVLLFQLFTHPQMMELNDWLLLVPNITPIVFFGIGCWLGQRWRKAEALCPTIRSRRHR